MITANIANTQGDSDFDIVQFVGDEGVAFNLQQTQVEMTIGTDQTDTLALGSSDQSIINGGVGNGILAKKQEHATGAYQLRIIVK